ncbi:MAG: hypothetical protein KIS77_03870 [Saprospiraceae bacterium]|nr:hypothetical protein [Saprospiraceae bacterium]
MKKEVKHLYNKAIESLILSVEIFNRPSDSGRVHGVLIFMDHSFEMLLKSGILHKGGQIRDKRKSETIGFSMCVKRALSEGAIRFLSEGESLTLNTINSLRDAAQHHVLEMSEQHLYFHAQAGLTLFRDLALRLFNDNLRERIPSRVLPLSTIPPTEIQEFFSNEVEDIRRLLQPRSRKSLEASERLRGLAIMENTTQGVDTQPSNSTLNKIIKRLKSGDDWAEIFPGVATLTFTAEGYGPSLDLRIVKQGGIPVQVVPEDTAGVQVALKRVNELDFYNFSRNELADKMGLSGPKTSAAIEYFKIKEDPECYKSIKIGKSKFDRYSPKTIKSIQVGLEKEDIEQVWGNYSGKRKTR